MEAGILDHERRINESAPALAGPRVGTVLRELLDAYNDLAGKYQSLLQHLDAANVGGIGNGNAAAYSPTTAVLRPLNSR